MKATPTIRVGPGLALSSGPRGVSINLLRQPRQSVAPRVPPHPFQLFGIVEGLSLKIRVTPGLVNNAIPAIGSTSIATYDSEGKPPFLTVTGSAGIIVMRATLDFAGTITALSLANFATVGDIPADTSPPATPIYKYKVLGTWQASDGAFTSVSSILNTNQTLFMCGGTAIWE